MSAHLELLRFNWKPSVIRLALAALADAGPVARRVWVVRAGLPANHFAAALDEARRLGLVVVEMPAEGLRLLVQPVGFWKERPLSGAEDFARAWNRAVTEQRRLPLVTEMPGLAEGLAVNVQGPGSKVQGPEAYRIPVVTGTGFRLVRLTFNVQRLRRRSLKRLTLNDQREPDSGRAGGSRRAKRTRWRRAVSSSAVRRKCGYGVGAGGTAGGRTLPACGRF